MNFELSFFVFVFVAFLIIYEPYLFQVSNNNETVTHMTCCQRQVHLLLDMDSECDFFLLYTYYVCFPFMYFTSSNVHSNYEHLQQSGFMYESVVVFAGDLFIILPTYLRQDLQIHFSTIT